jgi:hypothetical protein
MFEYVLDQLQRCKGQWQVVARETQISKRTIEKIAAGQIADPGVIKIQKLAEYFRGRGAEAHGAAGRLPIVIQKVI